MVVSVQRQIRRATMPCQPRKQLMTLLLLIPHHRLRRRLYHPMSQNNKNVLFSAVTNLNAQLTMPHAALPPRTAFLLFPRHSDPRSMSVLAARRAQYWASKNHNQRNGSAASAAGYGCERTIAVEYG